MDEQVVGMIRDSLEQLHGKCDSINENIARHIDKDEQYWKKIDLAEGQISFIKWIMSGLSVSGLMAWLFSQFGKH